jgi:hypothetical protein
MVMEIKQRELSAMRYGGTLSELEAMVLPSLAPYKGSDIKVLQADVPPGKTVGIVFEQFVIARRDQRSQADLDSAYKRAAEEQGFVTKPSSIAIHTMTATWRDQGDDVWEVFVRHGPAHLVGTKLDAYIIVGRRPTPDEITNLPTQVQVYRFEATPNDGVINETRIKALQRAFIDARRVLISTWNAGSNVECITVQAVEPEPFLSAGFGALLGLLGAMTTYALVNKDEKLRPSRAKTRRRSRF